MLGNLVVQANEFQMLALTASRTTGPSDTRTD
jgi:hypothetical protein